MELKVKEKEKYVIGKGWVKVNEFKTLDQIRRMFNKNTTLINIVTSKHKSGGDYSKEMFVNEILGEEFTYDKEFDKKKLNSIVSNIVDGDGDYSRVDLEIEWDEYIKPFRELLEGDLYYNYYDEEGEYVDTVTIGRGSAYFIYKEIDKLKKKNTLVN